MHCKDLHPTITRAPIVYDTCRNLSRVPGLEVLVRLAVDLHGELQQDRAIVPVQMAVIYDRRLRRAEELLQELN